MSRVVLSHEKLWEPFYLKFGAGHSETHKQSCAGPGQLGLAITAAGNGFYDHQVLNNKTKKQALKPLHWRTTLGWWHPLTIEAWQFCRLVTYCKMFLYQPLPVLFGAKCLCAHSTEKSGTRWVMGARGSSMTPLECGAGRHVKLLLSQLHPLLCVLRNSVSSAVRQFSAVPKP